ncbi:MAG: hypothetical protein A2075_00700 [Geobacteraceae bacterium GWC2_58_44]|nr:MAG: hypothetical protein A2075_00700 [Geobacteraceae bacterium GWC2_58_44]
MKRSTDNFLWPALSILVLSICLFSTTAYGDNKMDTLYNIKEAKPLKPQMYDIQITSSLSLFPVPQDNALGTNDLNNAITLLSFHQDRITYDKYFKNAVHDVEGGGEYIPIVSQDIIGFGQTRRFLLYDFEYKTCQNYRIVVSLEKTIEKIAIADARQRHFIFEIQAHNGKSEDPWDYTSLLLLMDLNSKETRVIKEMTKGKEVTWSMVSDKIFLYDRVKEQLQVLTVNFEPSHHPLADVIKRNRGKIRFMWIHPHPYLPFAILSGGKNGAMSISWGPDRDTTPHDLFSRATQFSFSPDGKWVVFRKKLTLEQENTYLMPVSEKYPNYLGSPILLSNNYFNANNFGWTTNPISFVGSSLNKIYRWELSNAAHPESDKATFWDYVVEHDLEKLTKEKRQGLGEKHK